MVDYSSSKYNTIRGIEIVKEHGFAKTWDVKNLAMHTMWIQYFLHDQAINIIHQLVDHNSFSSIVLDTLIKSRLHCDDWSYVYKDMPDILSKLEDVANQFTKYLLDTETLKTLIIKHFEKAIKKSKAPHEKIRIEMAMFQNIIDRYKDKMFYDEEMLEALKKIEGIIEQVPFDLNLHHNILEYQLTEE